MLKEDKMIKVNRADDFNNEEKIAKYQYLMQKYEKTQDEQIKEKALKIRNEIVLQNIPLIKKLLAEFTHPVEITYDDLLDSGVLALINAIDKYNFESAVFSTYAVNAITNEIIYEVTYWYGEGKTQQGRAIRRYRKIATDKCGGYVKMIYDKDVMDCVIDIMEKENLLKQVSIPELKMRLLSHAKVSEEEQENVTVETEDFDRVAFIRENRDELFQDLTEKERKIIEYRYGFEDGNIHKLEEISSLYKVSPQAIHKQEKRALVKIRERANKILQ